MTVQFPIFRLVASINYMLLFASIIFFGNYRIVVQWLIGIPIGGAFTLMGVILIISAHKELPIEHAQPEKVTRLATKGIYSKIRHPIYLGFMLLNFGFSSIFANYIALILSIFLIPAWYMTSKSEERFLIKKFGKEYEGYMRRVKWRFIPRLF